MDSLSEQPLVKFYRFIPTARAPERADKSAAGSMPTRAFRYCEAMRTASAFGWYIFPPMSFKLMWDGANFSTPHRAGRHIVIAEGKTTTETQRTWSVSVTFVPLR